MSLRYKGGVISATPPTVSATSPNAYGTAKGVWTLEQQLQYQGSGTWPSPFTPVYIEDVFNTWLYTGNGSTQTITNNIDLSGEGGLVWLKKRSAVSSHWLLDTIRGGGKPLNSNTTNAEPGTTQDMITSFNSNGFSLGTEDVNDSSATYASWTFRKQAKFFDVVTYTGNGANRTIAHNLGSVPGCIIVKRTDTTAAWAVYHRSFANTEYLVLNTTAAKATGATYWNSTTPTSTVFSLGTSTDVNANNGTYVAYLFAHDAGGFGANGTDNVISCGSYTGNGSATGPTIDLGWEPQWLLLKRATGDTNSWYIFDNMRGMVVGGNDPYLIPNATNAEDGTLDALSPTATGFQITNSVSGFNANGSTYIYIAIRRGPMKTPTSATSVFIPVTYTGDGGVDRFITSGFVSDFAYIRDRNDGTEAFRQNFVQDRLRGGGVSLVTNSTGAEGADTGWTNTDMRNQFQSNTGMLVTVFSNRYNASSKSYVSYQFARAPGFMDVVCYGGTGSNRTISHNLGVAPELIFVKSRNGTRSWAVYNSTIGNTKYLLLNSPAIPSTDSTYWNNTTPTSSVFTVGTSLLVNASGENYVAYLFASLAGVSKVGTYTGNGTNQNIDCGFTNGVRFVMIRDYSGGGDWTVFDSARGIVASNDPFVTWNDPNTEITTSDSVDTYSGGFNVVQNGTSNLNFNTQTYIYLAIA